VRRLRLAVAAAAACALTGTALPAVAHARILRAEDVLPPGQSGYVSIPGTAAGTGSPHLTDQTNLFVNFQFKSAMFDQPGTEKPISVQKGRAPWSPSRITGS
jgi:penicillin G amidase